MKSIIGLSACVAVAAVLAMPAHADEKQPLSLLFANSSSAPLAVQSITIDGKACARCSPRTLAPGATALIPVGYLAGKHLEVVMASSGGPTKTFKSDGSDSSMSGSGDSSKIDIEFVTSLSGTMMFDSKGTPVYDFFYAYNKPASH